MRGSTFPIGRQSKVAKRRGSCGEISLCDTHSRGLRPEAQSSTQWKLLLHQSWWGPIFPLPLQRSSFHSLGWPRRIGVSCTAHVPQDTLGVTSRGLGEMCCRWDTSIHGPVQRASHHGDGEQRERAGSVSPGCPSWPVPAAQVEEGDVFGEKSPRKGPHNGTLGFNPLQDRAGAHQLGFPTRGKPSCTRWCSDS